MNDIAFRQKHISSRRHSGLSLVELLVSITVGLILIAGAAQVYVNSKGSYEVNEAVARLQETARYALSVMEPDIRMANNWGLTNHGESITINNSDDGSCGAGFGTATAISVQGDNDGYGNLPPASGGIACTAFGAGAVASADTITVRHATATITTPIAGTLQVCSNTDNATISSTVGAGNCGTTLTQQLNDLVANTYYVSRDSQQAAGLPSLRRKALFNNMGTPTFQDVEIIPGVEDLQVQYGVAAAGSTNVVQYVDAWAPGMNVVAVRLWVLVRSENTEPGFTDGKSYEYGNRSSTLTGVTNSLNATNAAGRAYQPNDGYRRLLISRTIQIRSALAG